LTPTSSSAGIGINSQPRIGGGTLPLVIGDRSYASGLALPSPGFMEFHLPPGFYHLTGTYGISPLGNAPADAGLEFLLDGKKVLSVPSAATSHSFTVDVHGAHVLRIESTAKGNDSSAVVVGDTMLLTQNTTPPPSFSMKLTADQLAIQKMRARAASFTFPLPATPKGYVIYAGHPDDDVNPAVEPLAKRFPESLSEAAAPGQYEAVQFTLCAARDLHSVRVDVSDLKSPAGTIPRADIDISLIRRVLERKGYWMPLSAANEDTVSRFLFPNHSFDLPARNFKQVYTLVHVPQNAAAGIYTGTIRITPQGLPATEMAIKLQVYPFKLQSSAQKRYGVYYRLPRGPNSAKILDAEFADIAAHGCTMVESNAGIQFSKDASGNIVWSFDDIKTLLNAGLKHGFSGEITINDNIARLGNLLGHKGLDTKGEGQPLSEQKDVLDVATRCFADLKKLQQQYPQYRFLLTHMDEVFNPQRIDRFIDLSKVVRKTCDFPIYITMHLNTGWQKYMEKSDPYVDVRCYNGHSLEGWLQRGHTWDDLAKMLHQSGDEGWIYHNMRGAFFAPEYNRFINGLFMWVSPLKVSVPWMYYSYSGSAFDDTDSDHFDFGYAFPSPNDPTKMISTLHWETFREGCDDMRYLVTLQDTITKAQAKDINVSAAKAWLDHVKTMLPQSPKDIQNITEEDPYTVAAVRRFSGEDLDAIRARTAQFIMQLQ
jgi:hypothetical protein